MRRLRGISRCQVSIKVPVRRTSRDRAAVVCRGKNYSSVTPSNSSKILVKRVRALPVGRVVTRGKAAN